MPLCKNKGKSPFKKRVLALEDAVKCMKNWSNVENDLENTDSDSDYIFDE